MKVNSIIIRCFGTTGVLLLLSLVMLAIVSAIVAFDQWPKGAGLSSVERVAVDRSEARGVDTVLVRVRRRAPVVRGVFLVRAPQSSFATARGTAGALPVAGGARGGRSGGGGLGLFGPPPPPVPNRPPGEGGTPPGHPVGPTENGAPEPDNAIRRAACGAREVVAAASPDAGGALPACQSGRRRGDGSLARTIDSLPLPADVSVGVGTAGLDLQVDLSR
ncbi:MAG TPA: hypothetical protein VF520_13550 [Thermoleophilaceae bacterium]